MPENIPCRSKTGRGWWRPAWSAWNFFSDELITAQTSDGRMHIKGEGLYIENLNAETGELLVKGRVIALSYDDGVKPASVLGRIFK